jgi:hypothetical protein
MSNSKRNTLPSSILENYMKLDVEVALPGLTPREVRSMISGYLTALKKYEMQIIEDAFLSGMDFAKFIGKNAEAPERLARLYFNIRFNQNAKYEEHQK